ncbi:MAG: SRPBCC family protein [Candidatus Aenigmarchaeota archaeon]|nr:SRPBCC family protein [Candidatus Aenigmarchaeota archaeon]
MKENSITVRIDKPIEEVFDFTTDPCNTHLWIPSIQEEVAEDYPPKIGTNYKNRGKEGKWNFYKVIEYEPGKIFTLSDREGNYHVRYTYKELDERRTEMTYFEWMNEGELECPFTEDILQNLKRVLEKR